MSQGQTEEGTIREPDWTDPGPFLTDDQIAHWASSGRKRLYRLARELYGRIPAVVVVPAKGKRGTWVAIGVWPKSRVFLTSLGATSPEERLPTEYGYWNRDSAQIALLAEARQRDWDRRIDDDGL